MILQNREGPPGEICGPCVRLRLNLFLAGTASYRYSYGSAVLLRTAVTLVSHRVIRNAVSTKPPGIGKSVYQRMVGSNKQAAYGSCRQSRDSEGQTPLILTMSSFKANQLSRWVE